MVAIGQSSTKTTTVKVWVGTTGNDTIDLATTLGNSSGINLAYGLNGVDSITGGGGFDFISGGQQPNTLQAGSGTETLVAGSSGDTLIAGTGVDTFYGGAGTDTIVFSGSSLFSQDIIHNLTPTDNIDLQSLTFISGSMSATPTYDSNSNTTTLLVSNGSAQVTLTLAGDYRTASWQFAQDGGGTGPGTIFHDPPTSPAGVAGEPINLALAEPSTDISAPYHADHRRTSRRAGP